MQKTLFTTLSLDELRGLISDCIKDSQPDKINLEEDFMNQREAAEWLGVSEVTLIKYRRQGKLPYEQLPGSNKIRFYKSELKKVIQRNRHLLQPSRK